MQISAVIAGESEGKGFKTNALRQFVELEGNTVKDHTVYNLITSPYISGGVIIYPEQNTVNA